MSKERIRELAQQHVNAEGGFDFKKLANQAHKFIKQHKVVSSAASYLGHPELALAAKSLGYGLVPLSGGYYSIDGDHITHHKTHAVKPHASKKHPGEELAGHPSEYRSVYHTAKFLDPNGKHPHYRLEGSEPPAGYHGKSHGPTAWNKFVSQHYDEVRGEVAAEYPNKSGEEINKITLSELSMFYKRSKSSE